MLLMILVLAFAGTGCQKAKTNEARVVFRVSNEGSFYFQPEGKSGYEKVVPDSLGNVVFTVELEEPGYYQYTSTKDRKKAPIVKIGAVYIILQIVFAV